MSLDGGYVVSAYSWLLSAVCGGNLGFVSLSSPCHGPSSVLENHIPESGEVLYSMQRSLFLFFVFAITHDIYI